MTPIALTKRMVTRIAFCGLLAIGATVHQESLAKWQSELAEKQEAANRQKQEEANSRERSKAIGSETRMALDRVKDGCEPIILTQNNRPARFQPNLRVFDAQTFPTDTKIPRFDKKGNPVNGVQYMPEGVTVCNEFGDTAIVARNGAIAEIRRVAPAQLDEFLNHYKQLKGAQSNGITR